MDSMRELVERLQFLERFAIPRATATQRKARVRFGDATAGQKGIAFFNIAKRYVLESEGHIPQPQGFVI